MINVPLGQAEPKQERSRMLKPLSVFFWNQFKPLSLLLRLSQNKLVLEASSFNDKRIHLPHLSIPARFVLFGKCHLLLLAIELTALQVLKHLHQCPSNKQGESSFCFPLTVEKKKTKTRYWQHYRIFLLTVHCLINTSRAARYGLSSLIFQVGTRLYTDNNRQLCSNG